VDDDLKEGVVGAQPIPLDDTGKDGVINSLEANISTMIRTDR